MIEHGDSLPNGTVRRAYGQGIDRPRDAELREEVWRALRVQPEVDVREAEAVSPEMVIAAIVSVVPMKFGPPESP